MIQERLQAELFKQQMRESLRPGPSIHASLRLRSSDRLARGRMLVGLAIILFKRVQYWTETHLRSAYSCKPKAVIRSVYGT